MRRILLVVLLAVGVATAACGDDKESPSAAQDVREDEMHHVHGLGINPRDQALVVATHTGLFRAAPGDRQATRIGDRRQDTMGFTVVGPDRFLGSGHPDMRDELPPLLGLIRSDDGGKSWTPVSLLGEADFHVLRAAGRRIYAYDATSGSFMVSADGGRNWSTRRPPAPVIDLAIHPEDADRLAVATPEGLYGSRDAGRRWTKLGPSGAGLLLWTDALYLFGGDGVVTRSIDQGRNWEGVGSFGATPVATASHDHELYVATDDGRVLQSDDTGETWEPRLGA